MPKKQYGSHRGNGGHAPQWILTVVPGGGEVFIPHFRLPLSKVWIQWGDGHCSILYRGTPIPESKLLSQRGLRDLTMAIAKRVASGAQGAQSHTTDPCAIMKKYTSLSSFLVDTLFSDGSDRTPGSITIFKAMEGGLRMCVSDKDNDEVAFVSGSSLTDLLKRADEGIASGTLDWRAQKKGKGRK